LRYIPSIPSFISAFTMKRCWILLKSFFCIYCEDLVVFVFASVNMLYYI
jgi:hypothetical protein